MRGILQGQNGGKRYKTAQISNLAITVGFSTAGTVKLTWTNPTDTNFKGLVIRYATGSYPTSPTDGSSFYDSNDATPVSTLQKNGFTDGTTYYFRAFAYAYLGATRVYNDQTAGAQISGIPLQTQGIQTFTASGAFTVPAGVTAIDVFLVGGGGGGGAGYAINSSSYQGGGGGGGGRTKTQKSISVTPGQTMAVIVGAGGAGASVIEGSPATGGNGGTTSIVINGSTYSSAGGEGGIGYSGDGEGGSGGGSQGAYTGSYRSGGAGGYDGSDGYSVYYGSYTGCAGQGTTTRKFGEAGNTLFSGGGGGGAVSGSTQGAGGAGGGGNGGYYTGSGSSQVVIAAASGGSNTGGGGGGGGGSYYYVPSTAGAAGGSGIAIIRWGY